MVAVSIELVIVVVKIKMISFLLISKIVKTMYFDFIFLATNARIFIPQIRVFVAIKKCESNIFNQKNQQVKPLFYYICRSKSITK
jgi:hypothetical protein